jgi:HD-GYP domain-containing protein (c-di-GMP phosphodiesterase class II)
MMAGPYGAARSREQAFEELLADTRLGLFDRNLVSEIVRVIEAQAVDPWRMP